MARKFSRLSGLVLLVCLLGCGAAQARLITDMAGRQVNVPDVINKVYATAPPATYMVYAVAPDMLVGLNSPMPQAGRKYIDPRVMKLPIMGGWFGQGRMANLETLLQAKPDVVLAFRWQGRTVQWKIEQTLEPLGLPVVCVEIESVRDYPKVLRFLGELLNRRQRGEALATYAQQTLDAMAKLRDGLADQDKLDVYYAEGGQGLQTECDTSFHTQLIQLCGAVNVHHCQATTIYGMDSISMEQVLAYNPQVILTNNEMFLGKLGHDPRWRGIRAVMDGRVYDIPTMPFNWFDRPPSFMLLLGAHWLANRLYPKLYDIDMTAETIKFFRLFLGVELGKDEAAELLKQ